jgi:glycosyltransferase involved in cell wall biosynthesis
LKSHSPESKAIFLFYGDELKNHGAAAYLSSFLKYMGRIWKETETQIADDPHLFAESVLNLLNNKKKRNALGQAGRDTATMFYDWRIIGEQLLRLYEDIWNKHKDNTR